MATIAMAACIEPGTTTLPTDVEPPETELRGIYTVDTWTQNIAGCDEEGDDSPLFSEERLFGIHPDADTNGAWLHAFICVDVDNCNTNQRLGATAGIDPTRWQLVDGSDSDGWTNALDAATEDGETMCRGVREVTTLTATGDSVTLEVRNLRASFEQVEGDSPCPSELVEENLGECYKLEVLTATYQEPLADPQ